MIPCRGVPPVQANGPQIGNAREVIVVTRRFDNTQSGIGLRPNARLQLVVFGQCGEYGRGRGIVLHMPGNLGGQHPNVDIVFRQQCGTPHQILGCRQLSEVQLHARKVHQAVDVLRRTSQALLKELGGLRQVTQFVGLLALLVFLIAVLGATSCENEEYGANTVTDG